MAFEAEFSSVQSTGVPAVWRPVAMNLTLATAQRQLSNHVLTKGSETHPFALTIAGLSITFLFYDLHLEGFLNDSLSTLSIFFSHEIPILRSAGSD